MKKTKKDFSDQEVDIKFFLDFFLKNKITILVFMITFALLAEIFPTNQTSTRQMETRILIQKPPETIFKTFLTEYSLFFKNTENSFNEQSKATGEMKDFYKGFKINFISIDNFIRFLSKTNNLAAFDLAQSKNLKYDFYEKIGTYDFTDEQKKIPLEQVEIFFLKHKSNVNGVKILQDYINYVYKQTTQGYIFEQKRQFEIILNFYLSALRIAEEIGISDPQPQFHNPNIVNIENLYSRGFKILRVQINMMKLQIARLSEEQIYYDPIVDTPYTLFMNNNSGDVTPKIVKGLLTGLFLSIFFIFLKGRIFYKKKRQKR